MSLANCPNCGDLFVKSVFRTICEKCFREEEKQYETVYNYLRKRENRTAMMAQVVEATGVKESLIIKFVKEGRLHLSQFPNLGYPCDRCGTLIREGKLCTDCSTDIQKQIDDLHRAEEEKRKQAQRRIYYGKKEG